MSKPTIESPKDLNPNQIENALVGVGAGFVWSETKQGYDFWAEVYDVLDELLKYAEEESDEE